MTAASPIMTGMDRRASLVEGLQNEFPADAGGVPHGYRYAFQILTSIYDEDLSLVIYVLYLLSDSVIKSLCLTLSLTDSKEAAGFSLSRSA